MSPALNNIIDALAKSPFAAEISASVKTDADKQSFVNFIISFSIKALVDSGIPMNVAFDAIVGDGQYRNLSDSVWERCRELHAAEAG